MEELVKLVAAKTGLSEDVARTAVNTVIGFLKGKLPPAVAGQIDGILGGQQAAGHDAGGVLKGVGDALKNPFGKK